jgi:L-rhamnose mutarotase
MDYLVYVEHNAENLQFYLWYKSYVRRFNELPEKEKALSPEWIPETQDVPNLSKDSDQEAKKVKRNTIAAMMEIGSDANAVVAFSDEKDLLSARHASVIKDNASVMAPSIADSAKTLTNSEVTAQAGLKWQPCTSYSFTPSSR